MRCDHKVSPMGNLEKYRYGTTSFGRDFVRSNSDIINLYDKSALHSTYRAKTRRRNRRRK